MMDDIRNLLIFHSVFRLSQADPSFQAMKSYNVSRFPPPSSSGSIAAVPYRNDTALHPTSSLTTEPSAPSSTAQYRQSGQVATLPRPQWEIAQSAEVINPTFNGDAVTTRPAGECHAIRLDIRFPF